MLEATTEDLGIMDAVLRTDGKGLPFLHIKAGGSVCPPPIIHWIIKCIISIRKDVLYSNMQYPTWLMPVNLSLQETI